MRRAHRVRNFKPYLMRYVHNNDPNYEPVLRELLDHEHEVYDELTLTKKEMGRGEREGNTWEVVFAELTDVLTPVQIEKLFDRMEKDFRSTCATFAKWLNPRSFLSKTKAGLDSLYVLQVFASFFHSGEIRWQRTVMTICISEAKTPGQPEHFGKVCLTPPSFKNVNLVGHHRSTWT